MADNERIYTINLSRSFAKLPHNRRAEGAVKTVRAFAQRHMKGGNVKISADVANSLYERGIKKPARRLKVVLEKQGDIVLVRLFGAKKEEKKEAIAQPAPGEAKQEAKPAAEQANAPKEALKTEEKKPEAEKAKAAENKPTESKPAKK